MLPLLSSHSSKVSQCARVQLQLKMWVIIDNVLLKTIIIVNLWNFPLKIYEYCSTRNGIQFFILSVYVLVTCLYTPSVIIQLLTALSGDTSGNFCKKEPSCTWWHMLFWYGNNCMGQSILAKKIFHQSFARSGHSCETIPAWIAALKIHKFSICSASASRHIDKRLLCSCMIIFAPV